MRKNLLCLAALALLITSCDNGTDAPGLDAWRNPDAGTILVYRSTQDRATIEDSTHEEGTVSLEIVSTGVSIGGEENISVAIGPEGDSLLFGVRPNGDFIIGHRFADGIRWDVHPTGSKGTIITRDIDSLTNGTDRDEWRTTMSYAGEETIYIGDKEFYTIKVIQNDRRHESSPDWDYLSTASDTLYFAPDIGFIVRQRGSTETLDYGERQFWSRTSIELQAYIKR